MIATLLLAALLSPPRLCAEDPPLTVHEYREQLDAVRVALHEGDADRARDKAQLILRRKVVHDGAEFATDDTLLGGIGEDTNTARLDALIEALAAIDPAERAAPRRDDPLLRRLRREEAFSETSRGGDLGEEVLPTPDPPQSIMDRLAAVWEWVWEKIQAFLEWLGRLFFNSATNEAGSGSMKGLVAVLVIAGIALLLFVTILALRRRKGVIHSASSVAAATAKSSRDEDPLSRSAAEWERFAGELFGAGRFREAIRAWYHCLLVTMFRAGALHYRKDRTNWEYAFSLAPDLGWRPRFMESTRTFEREWYGRRNTGEDTADEFRREAIDLLGTVREGVGR